MRFLLLLLTSFIIETGLQAQRFNVLDRKKEDEHTKKLIQSINVHPENVYRGGMFSAEDSAQFQEILKMFVEDSTIIGLTAGITDDEGANWSGVENHSTVPEYALIDDDFVFGIGSNTKSITSASILLLMEDSLLSLEDTLGQWIPEYPNIDPGVTIRQLLQMTSGIYNFTDHPQFFDSIFVNPARIWTPQEILTTFVKEPLFEKGTDWAYSNTNYVLLGLIIEKITGMPYHEFVRMRIIDPLGLSSFAYYPQEDPKGPLAHFWGDINDDNIAEDITALGISMHSFFSAAGAAGAYTGRAIDLAKWFRLLFSGQVLQPASLEEMKKEYFLNPMQGYGLGINVIHTSIGDLFGHSGSIIHQSIGFYQPDIGVSISVMVNNVLDGYIAGPVYNSLLIKYLTYTVGTVDPDVVSKKIYCSSIFNDHMEIDARGIQKCTLQVFDISNGQLMFQNDNLMTDRIDIDTGLWHTGSYLITISNAKKRIYSKKIIKVK